MAEKSKKTVPKKEEIFSALEANEQFLKLKAVHKIGLFGSFARSEGTYRSDIDFIVDFSSPTFDNFMTLSFYLEKLFKRKIDLVTTDGLSKQMLNIIEKDVIWYEV